MNGIELKLKFCALELFQEENNISCKYGGKYKSDEFKTAKLECEFTDDGEGVTRYIFTWEGWHDMNDDNEDGYFHLIEVYAYVIDKIVDELKKGIRPFDTGFNDKNGNKLYSGDKVVFKNAFPLSIPDGATGKIEWHKSANEWTIWNEYCTIYGNHHFDKVIRFDNQERVLVTVKDRK